MSSYEEMVDKMPKTELPSSLEEQGVKVVEIPARTFGTRKVFINLKPEHTAFKQGQRVLPAEFIGVPDQGPVYFDKTIAPGSKFYLDGGHQCLTQLGGIRTFHLDALMIYPTELKGKDRGMVIEGLRKRGRPSNPNKIKVEKDPNAPKGKRGRPAMDPELKAIRDAEKASKPQSTGGKRGRPALPDHLKKQKVEIIRPEGYVPKRGRAPLDPEVKAAREAEAAKIREAKIAANGGQPLKRGRPKKSN